MPFECSKLFDDAYEFSFSSIGLKKIFNSNLYTSLLLTTLIVFIIVLLFPSKKDTPIYILFKVGLYIFITSYITIFLYGCMIKNTNTKKIENNEIIQYGGTSKNPINFGYEAVIPDLNSRSIIGCESYDIKDDQNDNKIASKLNITDSDDNIFSLYGV
jgi:hypothetical protein